MDILDTIQLDSLSDEFGLYRPDFNNSNAGVLPEIIRKLFPDHCSWLENHVENTHIRKRLDEYPEDIEKIIFVLVDGLGANHLQQMGGMLADNVKDKGLHLSSLFPSMTATIMSSVAYGILPDKHGLVGYNIYNEHLDDIWNSLNLKYRKKVNGGYEDSEVLDDVGLEKLIQGTPLVHEFSKHYPKERIGFISPEDLQTPNLLDLISPKFPITQYSSIEDGIRNTVAHSMQSRISVLYYPLPDHYGHLYSPNSQPYGESIRGVEKIIEHLKAQNLKNTAIVLTSDHGQSQVDHSISKWMSREQWQQYRNEGVLLSTSGRVIHAYCPQKLDRGKSLLEEFADGRGMVIDNKQAMELAGGDVRFKQRMGNYLMIMENNYLYDVPEIVKFDDSDQLHGQHGSLTVDELVVPFGIF